MTDSGRAWTALASLALIIAITASWWALALWPVADSAPDWILRTRLACFGTTPTGLPDAGGWLLLIGQPLGMLGVLIAVWPTELRAGVRLAAGRIAGQLAMGITGAALIAGIGSVAVRVAGVGSAAVAFTTNSDRDIAAALTRIDDESPALALVDQQGRAVTLGGVLGRPVLVTFAYAHCQTVCPLTVNEVLTAERRLQDRPPVVLIVTLDPWRDTPSRLGAIADAWGVGDQARVLSGDPGVVERTLNAWRVPRVRNERTGELSHPSVVYVIGPDGRIAYVVAGNADAIVAAVRAL